VATLREYFDGDFENTVKIHAKLASYPEADIDVVLLYDFSAFIAFVACYIPGDQRNVDEMFAVIDAVQPGKTVLSMQGQVGLPPPRLFPTTSKITNGPTFVMQVAFHGDPELISLSDFKASTRVFLYSESRLSESDIFRVKQRGREAGLQVQFRSVDHAELRSQHESPLAFICHDSRDKAEVARNIAINLQRRLCPVWYDEFSLGVGDNLRDSIERGLKKCRKCILILSPHFFSNGGWTKREFDSIFTREILEQQQLVLPVWLGVSKEQVYEYSPSLLNVKGLDWNQLGDEEVCRQLTRAILNL
jgi:hypothetical protein